MCIWDEADFFTNFSPQGSATLNRMAQPKPAGKPRLS